MTPPPHDRSRGPERTLRSSAIARGSERRSPSAPRSRRRNEWSPPEKVNSSRGVAAAPAAAAAAPQRVSFPVAAAAAAAAEKERDPPHLRNKRCKSVNAPLLIKLTATKQIHGVICLTFCASNWSGASPSDSPSTEPLAAASDSSSSRMAENGGGSEPAWRWWAAAGNGA